MVFLKAAPSYGSSYNGPVILYSGLAILLLGELALQYHLSQRCGEIDRPMKFSVADMTADSKRADHLLDIKSCLVLKIGS